MSNRSKYVLLGILTFLLWFVWSLPSKAGELSLVTLNVSKHFSSKDYNETHDGIFLAYYPEPHFGFGGGSYINSEGRRSRALTGFLEAGTWRDLNLRIQLLIADGYERGTAGFLAPTVTWKYVYLGLIPGAIVPSADQPNVLFAGFTVPLR